MASVRTFLLFDWPLLMLILADEGEVVKQVLVCNKGVPCRNPKRALVCRKGQQTSVELPGPKEWNSGNNSKGFLGVTTAMYQKNDKELRQFRS